VSEASYFQGRRKKPLTAKNSQAKIRDYNALRRKGFGTGGVSRGLNRPRNSVVSKKFLVKKGRSRTNVLALTVHARIGVIEEIEEAGSSLDASKVQQSSEGKGEVRQKRVSKAQA